MQKITVSDVLLWFRYHKSEAYKEGFENICEIGRKRIELAGARIKKKAQLAGITLDTGFRVLKLDSSNMEDVYYTPREFTPDKLFINNIKTQDRSSEDLLFQVMLDLGIELSAKIEEHSYDNKKVFFVDNNYLIACFDKNISESIIETIARLEPYYFVMCDHSLSSDSMADNFDQIFRTYSKDTIRKIL